MTATASKLCRDYSTALVGPPGAAPDPIRVLYIEDNDEQADYTMLLLSPQFTAGFSVRRAASLTEAMPLLKEEIPDVILLDLGLPELSGHRTFTAVHIAAPQVPVVVLTADDSPLTREMTVTGGTSTYLLKHDLSPDRLQNSLRQAVAEWPTSPGSQMS